MWFLHYEAPAHFVWMYTGSWTTHFQDGGLGVEVEFTGLPDLQTLIHWTSTNRPEPRGIGPEHRALQSPRRRSTVWKQDTMKKRVVTRGVVSDVPMSKRGRGELILLPYVISSLSLRTSS